MTEPRKSTRTGTRGYAHLVEIDVPVARVWRALTDPSLMQIWSGQEVEVDARKDGLYRIGKRSAGAREAHIDVFDVNRRLRLIYLPARGAPPSETAMVDDFLLDVRKGVNTSSLRLLGSGISDAAAWDHTYVRTRMAWERFLARIKVTLESPPKPKKTADSVPKDPPLKGLDY